MSESLRKKIVFASLPLALLWAAFNYPSEKNHPQPSAPETVVSAESQVTATSIQAQVKAPVAIDVEAKRREPWGSDPFRSSGNTGRTQADQSESHSLSWVLAGIIYNEQNPMAFVNRRMVGVGDQVGSATVTAIDRESVTLEYQGRTITLKLHKG
jgi:type II secretory pathway component PulC